jgi:hypothetical protein
MMCKGCGVAGKGVGRSPGVAWVGLWSRGLGIGFWSGARFEEAGYLALSDSFVVVRLGVFLFLDWEMG